MRRGCSLNKPSGRDKPTPEVDDLPRQNSSAVVNHFYLDRLSGSLNEKYFSQVGACLKSCKTTVDSFILIQNPFFLCFIQNIAKKNKRLQFKMEISTHIAMETLRPKITIFAFKKPLTCQRCKFNLFHHPAKDCDFLGELWPENDIKIWSLFVKVS